MSAPPSLDNQTPASPWVLFGIDLSTVGQDWLRAMRELYNTAPLRWFELNPPIQVLHQDGSIALWQAGQATSLAEVAHNGFTAVELPEGLILRRALSLPDLPNAQIQDAVALDLMSSSPFQADDIAWGFTQTRTDNGIHIHAAFASRVQIAHYLSNAASQQGWPSDTTEVWVFAPDSRQPIVLQGYGEPLAEKARNKRRIQTSSALAILAALLVALAIMPTLQLRHQAIQAEQAYHQLLARTGQLSEERALFTKALDSVAQIKTYNEQRINPLEVLELLSDALPKDVSVIGLKIQDQSVELTAEADNAAAIIQALGELEPFAEIRTTRPVQQVAQANKERFTVELRIAAGAFNVKYSEELIEAPPVEVEVEVEVEPEVETEAVPTTADTALPAAGSAASIGGTQNSTPASSTAVIGSDRSRRGEPSDSSGVAPPPAAPQPLKRPPVSSGPTAATPAAQDSADNDNHETEAESFEETDDVDSNLIDEESQS